MAQERGAQGTCCPLAHASPAACASPRRRRVRLVATVAPPARRERGSQCHVLSLAAIECCCTGVLLLLILRLGRFARPLARRASRAVDCVAAAILDRRRRSRLLRPRATRLVDRSMRRWGAGLGRHRRRGSTLLCLLRPCPLARADERLHLLQRARRVDLHRVPVLLVKLGRRNREQRRVRPRPPLCTLGRGRARGYPHLAPNVGFPRVPRDPRRHHCEDCAQIPHAGTQFG